MGPSSLLDDRSPPDCRAARAKGAKHVHSAARPPTLPLGAEPMARSRHGALERVRSGRGSVTLPLLVLAVRSKRAPEARRDDLSRGDLADVRRAAAQGCRRRGARSMLDKSKYLYDAGT